jgi:hypothetical protein
LATKFYLDRDLSEVQGTLPATNASTSATAATWTPGTGNGQATTPLLINRTLSTSISTVAQTNLAYTTAAVTTNQRQPLLRWVSPPLAAQTIAAQNLSLDLGESCSNTASVFGVGFVVAVWRPSTGAVVGRVFDQPTAGFTSTTATASQTRISNTVASANTTPVTVQAGDVLIIEAWRTAQVQSMGTSYTNTIFYDGTTEGSSSNVAAFISFTNDVALQTLPAEIRLRATTSGNGTSGAFTMPLPAGTVDGDFLVVWAESNSSNPPLTTPTGWTKGTTFTPTGTLGFCSFYWAPYSASLTRSFTYNGTGSWCIGAYFKTGEVLDVDGAAVAAYVTTSSTTVNTGQPTTTGAGRYEILGYSHPAPNTLLAPATVSLDASATSGVPTSQSSLGHYLVHPLGASVTCPNHSLSFSSNVANKTGAGLLLKAAPSITEPSNPIGGPVDNFEA